MAVFSATEVSDAIANLIAQRDRLDSVLNASDPDDPSKPYPAPNVPGPATEEQIASLEAAVGLLPPSYKMFLASHNGLEEANGGADWFSVEQLLDFRSAENASWNEWIEKEVPSEVMDNILYFGATIERKGIYAFDRTALDTDSECEVMFFEKQDGLVSRYDNLVDCMQATANLLGELADEFS